MTCRTAFTLAISVVTGVMSMQVGLVRADTFVVNSTADEVDVNVGNGVCATAGGACTLRAAIQEADALPGPHEILLPAGVFYLTIPAAGPDDASTGDLNILRDVTIRGAGRDVTILDGLGATRLFRVAAAPPPGINAIFTDMTIRNGEGGGLPGGAIYHQGSGGLSVARLRFTNNHAGSGGAIYHTASEVRTIADCAFDDNAAIGGSGGAIYVNAVAAASATNILNCTFTSDISTAPGGAVYQIGMGPVVIDNCSFRDCQGGGNGGAVNVQPNAAMSVSNSTFEGNSSTGGGGAIYVSGGALSLVTLTGDRFVSNAAAAWGGACQVNAGGNLTVSSCHVADNMSNNSGGGIYYMTPAGNLVVENSDFTANVSQTGTGGGLYASLPGTVGMTNVDVTNNRANGGGGGVCVAGRSQATITNCRFAENFSIIGFGGGFWDALGAGMLAISECSFSQNTVSGSGMGGGLRCAAAGNVTISGSTFSLNEATGPAAQGGGISCSAGPMASLSNCTFSGNSAALTGGAAQCASPMTFTNCTFAQNSALSGSGAAFQVGGPFVTVQNCIVAASLAGLNCAGAPITSGGHNIDQMGGCGFAAAGDLNGVNPLLGPLQNNGGRTLTHALLGGSPAINAGGAGVCPVTDQRGLPRTGCDIGAFEFVSDCNNNGQDDTAEVVSGATPDCNHNGSPDSCDIAAGLSADCDGNGVPDACQTDSNGNGVIDACEPAPAGSSGPCGVCGMGVGMMMPLILLGMAWMRRRIR